MPESATESDTTGSRYPDEATNAFAGRKSEAERQQEAEQQHSDGDTTPKDSAEPAPSDADSSNQQEAPSDESEADTTADGPAEGDEAPDATDADGEVEAEADEAGAESEDTADAEGEEPEDGDELPGDRVWQYHGTEPEDEEYEDYAYISGYDPDQRYQSEEDLVNAHENLLQLKDQQHQQLETLQEQLKNARAEKEGETEELRAKVNLFEEQFEDEELIDMMADRYMPEKFQGLSEDDIAEENLKEFYRARAKAETEAEQEWEKVQSRKEEAADNARDREERLRDRTSDAEEFLESEVDEILDIEGENSQQYIEEAVSRLTPDGEEASNPIDLVYKAVVSSVVTPDSNVGFDSEESERIARLAAKGLAAEAEQIRQEEIQKRSERVKKKSRSATRGSSGPTPEKATESSSKRTVRDDNPRETFRKAG